MKMTLGDKEIKGCGSYEFTTAKSLNLGCGYRKQKNFINIDNRPDVEPDLVCDVTQGLPFDDDSIDMVLANDFLEHIPIGKTVEVIEEIYRVLKPGGTFESLTPSTDGRGAFQDPTHLSFWNQNSWLYFVNDEYRALYGINAKFEGRVQDYVTNDALHIIHTHAVMKAVKP
jgi:O-antigen biosynthesis protein